jgi:tetratricopeptide (TPR) repeat protein
MSRNGNRFFQVTRAAALPNCAALGYFDHMKFSMIVAIFLLALALSSARAQATADDQYIVIYSLMQQADGLANAGQPRQALSEFVEVQSELQKFQKIYPDWNPNIVSFRMSYLTEKIAGLTAQIPATNSPPPMTISPIAAPAGASSNFTGELNSLRDRLQSLQADNTTLAAKLKEALSAQPTAIDSRELVRAQEQIQSLMKQNALLKSGVARSTIITNTLVVRVVDTNALAQAQTALAEVRDQLVEQKRHADGLAFENESLQARMKSLLESSAAAEALREENALLKKQVAELKSTAINPPEVAQLKSDLAQARLQIFTLQSNLDVGSLEKMALENRIQQLQSSANAAPVFSAAAEKENKARIRELTQERNDLLAKLGEANKKIYGRKKQNVAAQMRQLADQVNVLRARLAVDESQVVPYTPEELALFKQAEPRLANPNAEKKSIKELPAGSAVLVAAAQSHFAAREFGQAEDDYQKILQHDQNNGLVLANLAQIELQEGKLDDAEKHIRAALAQNPNDAYNLSTLGYLKFQQEKYDDALDALSRAAKLDPQNPEIQNYLGVTLGHKGLRAQAETALRKAIQLDPNYGPAHNNLAVIYINQEPPLVALARWHYQKALDAGRPRNPELEKMLADKGAPVNPQ